MEPKEPLRTYEGRGETLDEALVDAAGKALDDDFDRNRGREFIVVRHVVTVDNPRISEHRIDIGG